MNVERFKLIKVANCKCLNWGRAFDNLLTSHHPNCSKFIQELVDHGAIVYSPDRNFIKKIYVYDEATAYYDDFFFYRTIESYFKEYNFNDADNVFELEDNIVTGDCFIKCNETNKNLIPYFKRFRIDTLLIANCLTVLYYINSDELCFIEKYFHRSEIYNYK